MELEYVLSRENIGAIKNAEDMPVNTRYGIEKGLWQSGKDIGGAFNRQVKDKKTKTGRIYTWRDKAGRKRRHQASAPGQSPANRSGRYRRSFSFNVRREDELSIINDAPYAGFLELGTSNMEPRPGLDNAIRASEADVLRNITTGIIKGVTDV